MNSDPIYRFFARFFARRCHGDGSHGDDVIAMVTAIATTAWSPVRVQKNVQKKRYIGAPI